MQVQSKQENATKSVNTIIAYMDSSWLCLLWQDNAPIGGNVVGIDFIVRISVELVQYDRSHTKVLYLHTGQCVLHGEECAYMFCLTLRLLKDNFWTLMANVTSEAVKLTSKSQQQKTRIAKFKISSGKRMHSICLHFTHLSAQGTRCVPHTIISTLHVYWTQEHATYQLKMPL